MDSSRRPDREAAEWRARLESRQVATGDLEAFYAWRRDPENARAYERVERVWRISGKLIDDPDIVAATARAIEQPGWLRLHWRGVSAAALIASLVVALSLWMMSRPVAFETGIGEQRLVTLDDGTRMQLDTNSHVEVRLGQNARRVEMTDGRAFFDVAHDAKRPFDVDVDGTIVTAVGTRFSVRRDGDRVWVVLSEGRVRIAAPDGAEKMLAPGEQVSVAAGHLQPAQQADLALLESWTSGHLIFRDLPLREATAEVNRYTRIPIVLAPDVDGSGRISGAFDAGDSAAFLSAVKAVFKLESRREADRIILSD